MPQAYDCLCVLLCFRYGKSSYLWKSNCFYLRAGEIDDKLKHCKTFFQVIELQPCKCFFPLHSSRKVLSACFRFSSYRLWEPSVVFAVFLDLQFNLHCNVQGLAFCQRNYLKISAFSINVQIKQVQQYEPLPKCRNMVHVHHTWRIHGALTILRLCSDLRIQQKLGYLVQCAFFCTSFRTTTIVRDREWSFAHVSLSWKLIFIWKKIFYKWQYLI